MSRRRSRVPLLDTHALEQASVLTADALMREVRRTRRLRAVRVPSVCVLDTGEHDYRVAVLNGIIAGAARFIRARRSQTSRTARTSKR